MRNKTIIITLLIVGALCSSYKNRNNSCQKVAVVKTDAEKRVMAEVIAEWKKERYFIADNHLNYKGVVHLIVGKDEQGRKRWGLMPVIADGYKNNPPAKYDIYDGTVILVYDADDQMRLLPIEGNLEERYRCMNEVIGDRLYINPPPTPHLHPKKMVEVTINGKKRMMEKQVDLLGNGGADYWVIFNKDGTYVKTPMA